MCTVSYLPTQEGFILTSNRDETPLRNAIELGIKEAAGISVHYPVDPRAGGSWFAVGEDGRFACILNGAFLRYDPSQEFPHSRGVVLLSAFDYNDLEDLRRGSDFSGTAPFTLVMVRRGKIEQLIWDGRHTQRLELKPHVRHFWSSVTLYADEVRAWRRELFERWCRIHVAFDQEEIMHFHRYGGRGDDQNDFVMNRENVVRTLSITSGELSADLITLRHEDLSSDSGPIVRTFTVQDRYVASP